MIEQELLQLVQIVEGQQNKIERLEQATDVLIKSNKQLIDWVDGIEQEFKDYRNNIRFELLTDQSEYGYWYPTIRGVDETIKKIVEEHKSIARFGDGEFSTIAGRVRHKFQSEIDEKLAARLVEVLHSQEEGLIIGIANNYGNLDKYTEQSQREIRRYLQPNIRKEHLNLLSKDQVYYDAYVTRPYVMYADNNTKAPKARFEALKAIWDRRDCVIVEGDQTRMGEGTDILDNANSIDTIIGPAENAFNDYERLFSECKKETKDKLFLLALGPTATVLAYDLCKEGYQAIDIGHLDLEYEWFLRGEGIRVEVPGKYNNEL